MENEPSKLEKTVVDNIRRIRQEKGISQLRLSIFCGTSASYIGLMETYKNIPKLSTIERIAEALNVSVIDLFNNYEEKDSNKKVAQSKDDKKEAERKEKIRARLKKETLAKIGDNLDALLQMI